MKHGHRVSVIGASLIAMVGIAGCGSEATDPVTDNRTPAQLTVGALLLPPVAVVLTVPPVTPEVWPAAVASGAPPMVRLVLVLFRTAPVGGLRASTPFPVLVIA
jgi:hypothetical protein